MRDSQVADEPQPSEFVGELGVVSIDHIVSPRRIVTRRVGAAPSTDVIEAEPDGLGPEIVRFVRAIANGESTEREQRLSGQTAELVEALLGGSKDRT